MTRLSRAYNRHLLTLLVAGVAAGTAVLGQQAPTPPPQPVNASEDPVLRAFAWRSIGPASMGGRVDDIEAVASDPSVIYVGYASGGVWKTMNMGTTWTPLFDRYPVNSIGDIAIAPSNPDILYVGTGESNNRQSTTAGAGVYRSADAGRTFTLVGLEDTHHISRIVVDPKDPNIVYVAAMGHLFGPNKERGLFKTTDGGRTWTNTKFIDENTGFTEVVMDPRNPRTLYAASYQRLSGRRGGTTAAGRGAASGRPSTPARHGRSSRATACRRATLRPHRPRRLAVKPDDRVRADRGRLRLGGNGAAQAGGGNGGPGQPPQPATASIRREAACGVPTTRARRGEFVSNNNNRPDVLQPDSHRSRQPRHRLHDGRAVLQVDRRR